MLHSKFIFDPTCFRTFGGALVPQGDVGSNKLTGTKRPKNLISGRMHFMTKIPNPKLSETPRN